MFVVRAHVCIYMYIYSVAHMTSYVHMYIHVCVHEERLGNIFSELRIAGSHPGLNWGPLN